MTIPEILEIFINKHHDLYRAMNEVDHAYNGTQPNKFHLEGPIWTHTCMVLKEAQNSSDVIKLAALCHDLGKPFVYEDKHDKQRRRFSQHEAVSTFYAKEVLESFDLTVEDKERVLKIVAQHGSMYNFFEDDRIPEKNFHKFVERYTYDDFNDLVAFYKCDHEGRFYVGDSDRCNVEVYHDFARISDIMDIHQTVTIKPTYEKKITVLIGPPRAGKSTWVLENIATEHVLVSRDLLVMAHGEGKTYSDRWNSISDEMNKTIDKELQESFQHGLKSGRDIIVDMTNMSKKSRRKWLSDHKLKEYEKEAVVFIESLSCLLSRNSPQKTIPEPVIKSMMKNFVFPQYDEFDTINIRR